MADKRGFDPQALVKSVFDKALSAQQPLAVANVERLRRIHPGMSPSQLSRYLNRTYLAAVTATGAGAGASSMLPNGVVQVPVAIADLLTFLEASVLYTLSVAEVHQVDLGDIERRRMLVTAVLIGDSAVSTIVNPLLDRSVPYWGKKAVQAIPMSSINAVNKVLGPRFVTRYGTRQGVLVLGKQIPFAIGVAVGAGGNHIFGRITVKAAKSILGPAPESWERVA